MRFRLIYRGALHATNNARTKGRDKWLVRHAIAPQLERLWATHPTLKGRGIYIPTARMGWMEIGVHEELGSVKNKLHETIAIGGRKYLPLVRRSLALTCELDILFMRNDAPGAIVGRSGGDLDNRIKTLFDGLRVPETNEVEEDAPPEDQDKPFPCLLEDDKLISTFAVRTDRLLTDPTRASRSVLLVMEVKVIASMLTPENLAFLTE
jgi:hypothetical protein